MTSRYQAVAGGAAAVAVSLLIHIVPAWFCPWSEPADEPETVYVLDLESLPARQEGGDTAQDRSLDPNLVQSASLHSEGDNMQTNEAPVLLQVRNQQRKDELDLVLARVRERLQPLWEQAHPPGAGQVELCLELTHQGEVHSVWVTSAHGSSQLADFILELVQEAGPYPRAGEHIADRLIVGCTFAVEQN